MKTVLWISRHEMTAEQLSDLERALGDDVRLVQWSDTVPDAESLRKRLASLKQTDAIAAVLPPKLLSAALEASGGRPVLQAVSGRLPTGQIVTLADGRREKEFTYAHIYWEQVTRLEIETTRL